MTYIIQQSKVCRFFKHINAKKVKGKLKDYNEVINSWNINVQINIKITGKTKALSRFLVFSQ